MAKHIRGPREFEESFTDLMEASTVSHDDFVQRIMKLGGKIPSMDRSQAIALDPLPQIPE